MLIGISPVLGPDLLHALRAMGHGDEIALLHNCLGSLSEKQRQMLTMAYFSGMTQQEISEKLVQPLGTVKARIRRGLIKLRNCIEGLS